MSFKTALRARLKENPVVLANNARVDWSARPQAGQFPAIVLDTISAGTSQHFLGVTGSQENRIQATVMAKTQAQAEALREAVRDVLIADASKDGITFQRGFVNLTRDTVENAEMQIIYHEILDVTIWFN